MRQLPLPSRKVGLPALALLLVVPLLGGATSSASPAVTGGTTSAAAPHAGGNAHLTISDSAAARAQAYWTEARMASAKAPAMARSGAPTAASAPGPASGGVPTSIAAAGPGDRRVVQTSGEQAAPQPEPQVFGRFYDYPAPFTRFQTAPAAQYKAYPNKTVGKLFFSNANGGNFVCSASVVNSENKDLVWTAGHCVSDGAGSFYRNFAFVPAYRSNVRPFGTWTPRSVTVRTEWHSFGNFSEDLAALVMNNNANGASIANVVGSLGLQWNWTAVRHWNAMGYPSAAPFNGQLQWQNLSSLASSDDPSPRGGPFTMGAGNDLTQGSSGGPWIHGYGSGNWVNGVNSYKYFSDMPLEMFSPYFGDQAADLYNQVRNS